MDWLEVLERARSNKHAQRSKHNTKKKITREDDPTPSDRENNRNAPGFRTDKTDKKVRENQKAVEARTDKTDKTPGLRVCPHGGPGGCEECQKNTFWMDFRRWGLEPYVKPHLRVSGGRVVNIKTGEPYDVYIGNAMPWEPYRLKKSIWANPYNRAFRKA